MICKIKDLNLKEFQDKIIEENQHLMDQQIKIKN